MKFRLLAPFALLVSLSICLLLWFGVRLANDEQRRVQEDLRSLQLSRLTEVEKRLQEGMARIGIRVKRDLESFATPVDEWARQMARKNRFIRQVFVLDTDQRFIFPSPTAELMEREQDALLRTRSIWNSGIEFGRSDESSRLGAETEGWHTWFWDTGLQFLFWQIQENQDVLCVELDRVAVFAELIAALPATDSLDGRLGEELFVLWNERQREIYRWGDNRELIGEAYVSLPMAPPLTSWEVALYLGDKDVEGSYGKSVRFNFISGFLLLGLGVGFVGVYIYREYLRELREASTRLTFVNQVSHELKTPLTNIRLYSELLEGQLDAENERARHSLGVIQGECRRLSRLIKNVLSFGRQSRGVVRLKRVLINVDDVVESVMEGFLPSLTAIGIQPQLNRGIGPLCMIDRDLLEQILGNLIANVEKYAADGETLVITTCLDRAFVVIEVADGGSGIPRDRVESVFEPFYRLSNRVSDGVAGTGIGLTIARDLARSHGGDLRVLPSETGARFELSLSVEEGASVE